MKITWTNKLYDYLNDEKGDRLCTDISEEACEHVSRNYFLILVSNMFTKLGDTLSNPKTVLAWLMNYIQVPVYLISFIVPIRESGSMIPQIFLSGFVRNQSLRKWIWIAGAVMQFLAVGLMGIIALTLSGEIAGWLIILCLVFFSFSRALCSVSSKDVLGKTIPKKRRGRLKGFTTSVSGILVLLAALFMIYKSRTDPGITFYTGIFFFAGGLWLLAAAIYAMVKEFPNEPTPFNNGWRESLAKINLIKTDSLFRQFIISRSLLLCSGLTAPFYILLAQEHLEDQSYLLGMFILANGLANIVSAPIWGKLADRSSKNVMTRSVLIASVMGTTIFLVVSFLPDIRAIYWTYPVAFFILSTAHAGVRIGRKTYIVDMATGDQRTDYVSVGNTIIGIILLVTGGISALASLVSVEGIILSLSILGFIGAYSSYRLPNVE